MKLALHRSITFWFGLLVMVFASWAWRDSEYFASRGHAGRFAWGNAADGCYLTYTPGRSTELFNERVSGFFVLTYQKGDHGSYLVISPLLPDLNTFESPKKPAPAFHPPLLAKDSTETTLYLPHWLILLAVATPWLGLLLWRARRRAASIPGTGGGTV